MHLLLVLPSVFVKESRWQLKIKTGIFKLSSYLEDMMIVACGRMFLRRMLMHHSNGVNSCLSLRSRIWVVSVRSWHSSASSSIPSEILNFA